MPVKLKRLSRHPRLGRSVQHDPRSLRFAIPALPKSALLPVHWQRRVPIFDQDPLSSCTGNSAAGWVATDNAIRSGLISANGKPIDETFAVECYKLATQLDDFPETYEPDDFGSSGLGAVKGLQQKGLVASYNHAFSFNALCVGLQTGPAMIGLPWFESMFYTEADGHIRVDKASKLVSGHEILADQLEIENGEPVRVWVTNSWGDSWSVNGRGYFTAAEMKTLLADDGDVICPVAATVAEQPPLGVEMVLTLTDADLINHVASSAKHRKQSPSQWATHHFRKYFGA